MKIQFNVDQIFCVWLFIWTILSTAFPSIITYYPTKITSVIAFVSGIIISTSNKFKIPAKIVIFMYHFLILLGYLVLERKHNLCIDILLFTIYILYMAARYNSSPYDTYIKFFYPPLEFKKNKLSLKDIISY